MSSVFVVSEFQPEASSEPLPSKRRKSPGQQHFAACERARHERIRVAGQSGPYAALGERLAAINDSEAAALLQLQPERLVSAREAVPTEAEARAEGDSIALWIAKDTLKNPNALTTEASFQRQRQTMATGIYEQALDAAETIEARDSIEKMLAHQMTLAHNVTFEMGERLRNERDPIETQRLVNSMARMMTAFQSAMVTLQRVRSGGRQTVTVQHVQVSNGGQAVVAGAMNTGGAATGQEAKS